MSALPPIATAKADMAQMVMSALRPKADMCSATRDVRFGPIADMGVPKIMSANARDPSKENEASSLFLSVMLGL